MAKFTRAQWVTLVVFGIANFCNAVCVSLQAPFYPKEAEKKGATATEYGLVFGIFELTVFIISPIYGKNMSVIGARRIYKIGIMTVATSCIVFGILDGIEDRFTFIFLCLVVRVIEALGNAAFLTSSFAIIAQEFPDRVATTFATLELCFGLGLIAGPMVGGALYDIGGYTVPFVVLGCVLYSSGFLAFCVLPAARKIAYHGYNCMKAETVIDALKVPAVAIDVCSIVVTTFTLGFLQATLEPHLRQFNLTAFVLGLVFVINGGVYALTSPVFGWLCDNYVSPKVVTTIGCVLTAIAFALLGPSPFIPFDTNLGVCTIAQVVHGMGLAAQLVSTFSDALREAFVHGFPDNVQTYGLICGMWASAFAFGSFIGPIVGGILLDNYGFRYASLFITVINLLMAVAMAIYLIRDRKRNEYDSINAPQNRLEASLGGGMVNSLSVSVNHCKFKNRELPPKIVQESTEASYGSLGV